MLRSPILSALREGTRAEHDAIEAALDMSGMSIDDYRRLLERFGGFYGPVERLLEGVGDWSLVGIDFASRRKMPRIERDLQVLGGVVRSAWSLADVRDDSSIAVAVSRGPQLELGADDWAPAFGALYVLEGASLGGQVITRRLQRDLGVTPERGGAFFSGYGDATRAMWVGFCEALAAFSPDPDQRIVDAAIATFQAMRHWCSGWTSLSNGS